MVEAEFNPPHPPRHRRCDCVLRLDVLQHVEKALRGLSTALPVSSSLLFGQEGKNLWITAGEEFLPHLRHVAVRKPLTWYLKVVSDAELTTAWLASIALEGKEILDADAYKVSTKFITIPDLVVPPDLLVLRMGIKAARNAASPEVLAEALNTRFHEGKPTWLWDEPHHPLNVGHLFWSDAVGRLLRPWEKVSGQDLDSSSPQKGAKPKGAKPKAGPGPRQSRKSLRKTGGNQ